MSDFHNNSFLRLRRFGYSPDSILDIGAHRGLWTQATLDVFPRSKYLMLDATTYDEMKDYLSTLSDNSQIDFANVVCGEKDGTEVEFHESSGSGDSMFKEKTTEYGEDRKKAGIYTITKRKQYTIGYILRQLCRENEKFDIWKIDCQGAELQILRGAKDIIENENTRPQFILFEMPFAGEYNEGVASFGEHIKYMENIGYRVLDIPEIHYTKCGFPLQVDILFVDKKSKILKKVQDGIEN